MSQLIKIKLRSFDQKLLDQSCRNLINTIKLIGVPFSGPIPLRTLLQKFTVNSSPHVNKKARDQLETRTHRRFVQVSNPTKQAVDQLMKVNLPSGVGVEIKLDEAR